MSRTRVRFGVATGPPNVSGPPNPASSMRTTSTFGAPSGGCGPGIIDQSATDPSMVRPSVPPKARSGMGSAVRSGLNFPAASARASSSSPRLLRVMGATDFAGDPASACSAASRSSSSTTATITAVPGCSLSPMPCSMPPRTRCRANLPIRPPAAAPTATEASSGGENRPTATPTPPPQPRPLRPRWSPVCVNRTRPSASCSTRITPSARTALSWIRRTSVSKSRSASPASGYAAMITPNVSPIVSPWLEAVAPRSPRPPRRASPPESEPTARSGAGPGRTVLLARRARRSSSSVC